MPPSEFGPSTATGDNLIRLVDAFTEYFMVIGGTLLVLLFMAVAVIYATSGGALARRESALEWFGKVGVAALIFFGSRGLLGVIQWFLTRAGF